MRPLKQSLPLHFFEHHFFTMSVQAHTMVSGLSDLVAPSTMPQPQPQPHDKLHLHKTPTSTLDIAHDTQNPLDNIPADDRARVHWDGRVWCSRFGRFENQEDAAHDDGYPNHPKAPIYQGRYPSCSTDRPPLVYELMGNARGLDRPLHRCEKSTYRPADVSAKHRSYVEDIKRRVEPMVRSIGRLEDEVERLVHHIMKDGQTFYRTGSFHNDGKNGGAIAVRHGELGDPLHAPIRDHNYTGEMGGILKLDDPPAIDLNASLVDGAQQPNLPPAAVGYITPSEHGETQELSHPMHVHYKNGLGHEGPPPERFEKFRAGYNQEWPHYERVRKEYTEQMQEKLRKLDAQVESLSRQIRILQGSKDGSGEEEEERGRKEHESSYA